MTEYFIPGTLPTKTCNEPKKVEQPVVKPEEQDTSETRQNSNSNNGPSGANGPGNGQGGGSPTSPGAQNPPSNGPNLPTNPVTPGN